MPSDFSETFDGLLRGFDAVQKATARVEWETDPETPGCTAYRISGHSREVVQAAIDTRYRTVKRTSGHAEFLNPVFIGGKWWSCGYVIRERVSA